MSDIPLREYVDIRLEEQEKRTALALAAMTRNQHEAKSTFSLVLSNRRAPPECGGFIFDHTRTPMMPVPPVPPNFGFRYVMWFLWCNAITVLMIVQGVLATVTLDPTLVPHDMLHWILVGNAVLCAVLAQIKRNNPPPEKSP